MSEEATLNDFASENEKQNVNETIEAVPDSSITSSLDETSVGEIPDDWIATRLGDIAEETEYGLTESAEDYDDNKPRYIRTQDFDDFGGLKENSRASLSRKKAKDGLLEEGDLLFARSGSVGASLGKTYLYDTDDGECCFGGYSIRHRLQDEGLNHKYISEYTLSEQYWDWVRRRAKTTAQSNINTGEYGSLLLPIPPLSEQRKIATVLYTIDRAIENMHSLINQFRRVKKSVSQNLLNHGLYEHELEDTDSRFGKLPSDWSVERLADVTDIVGRTEPPTDVDKYWNGEIPWAVPDDIRSLDSPTISDTETKVTQTALEEVSSNLVPPNSVLLTTRATVGLCAVNKVEMTTSRAFKDLIPGEHLDTWYLYYRISAMEDYLNRLGWGSTFTEVIKPVLQNATIPIPSLEEQKEIGSKLRSIDDCITKNIRAKRQYERLKRGLMQDLLSGKVRTTDTNIQVPDEITQYG